MVDRIPNNENRRNCTLVNPLEQRVKRPPVSPGLNDNHGFYIAYMEQRILNRNDRFSLILMLLLLMTSCIGIRMGSDVDLGNGFFYVQDYPQCICRYPDRKIVLPAGECNDIVIRVQYNDSIILATCTPGYHSRDTTVYTISKSTGNIQLCKEPIPDTCKYDNEVRNRYWYSK